jgi:hypothetical protein
VALWMSLDSPKTAMVTITGENRLRLWKGKTIP